MWNLRNKKGSWGREGKIKQDEIREGDKPQETLNHQKQTEGCRKGGGRGMGYPGDGY